MGGAAAGCPRLLGAQHRPRCGGRARGGPGRGVYKARGGRRSFVSGCSSASGSNGTRDLAGFDGEPPELGRPWAGEGSGRVGALLQLQQQ